MFIRKMGKWFAVLDDKEGELIRFNDLYDAAVVYLLLSGGKLPDSDRLRALMLINGGGTSGTARVPERMEKAEQGQGERIPEEHCHPAGHPGN